jgi:hypothetical protein
LRSGYQPPMILAGDVFPREHHAESILPPETTQNHLAVAC